MKEDRKGVPADDEFRKWFNNRAHDFVEWAKQIVFGQNQQLIPALFIFKRDSNDVIIAPVEMGENDQRNLVAAAQRAFAAHDDTRGVFFVTEAWVLAEDKRPEGYEGSYEHVPGRRESLMISCISGKMQLMSMYETDREKKDFIHKTTTDPAAAGKETFSGRFALNRPTKH